MKYTLLLYGDESRWATMTPEESAEDMQRWGAFYEELMASGAYLAGEGLDATASAVTVRIKDGEAVHTDGPFAETREQLGGYFLIEASDLDEAIDVAGRIPGARRGTIEIRPVLEISGLPPAR